MIEPSIRNALIGIGISLLFACTVVPCIAQSAENPSRASDRGKDLNARVTYFYRHGKLEQVAGILIDWIGMGGPTPPLIGFIAGLAAKYPEKIDQMFPQTLGQREQRIAVLGVRVGVSPARARMLALKIGWPESQLQQIDAGATLDEILIRTPQEQDLIWGASFSTGDSRYARRMLDHYILVVNQHNLDVDTMISLIPRLPGYSPHTLKAVREKHGDQGLRDYLLATAALWSLESNAVQHDFVQKVVNAYLASNANAPAAVGIQRLSQAARKARSKPPQ